MQEIQKIAVSTAIEWEDLYENSREEFYENLATEILDIEYTLDSRKDVIGIRLYVTIGGPTVWIDTRSGIVHAAWGTDTWECAIDGPVVDAMHDYFLESFN